MKIATLDEIKKKSSGSGINVAIVDSGINGSGCLSNSINGYFKVNCGINESETIVRIDSDPVKDSLRHGTNVARVINEYAVNSKFYSIKIFDKELKSNALNLLTALEFVVEHLDDCKLINLSLGLCVDSKAVSHMISHFLEKTNKRRKIVIASGKYMNEIYPINNNAVILVGMARDGKNALMRYDKLASEFLIDCNKLKFFKKHNYYNTSYATAFVTGLAALMLESNKDCSCRELHSALRSICN